MRRSKSLRSRTLCVVLGLGALISPAHVAVVLCPSELRAAESDAEDATREKENDGEFTIGPRTPTSLHDAVEAFNLKLSEFAKSGQHKARNSAAFNPLTEDEVVAAIGNWDRAKYPVPDSTHRLYAEIGKTRKLPPHSQLEVNDQWFSRDKHEARMCQIKLEVMTGKNQGYSFVIREAEIERRPRARPGYHWVQSPQQRDPTTGWTGWLDGSLKVSFDETDERALIVTVNRSYQVAGVQVVAIDEQNQVHDFEHRAVGAYSRFLADQFRLDFNDLPRERVKYIGVEAVESPAIKSVTAPRRVWPEHVKLLPPPEIGQPYDFAFLTGGMLIESKQLRGQVVLLDLWGSWCIPCLKKMPALKDLYAKWHAQGFEIIGISFDDDAEQAQAVIDRLKLPWHSVNLEPDSEARTLWTAEIPVTSLPTVLLIDRDGVLRYKLVGSSANVEASVLELLKEAAQPEK